MPAPFPPNVKRLARAVDPTSIEIVEFHEDYGSYAVYTYTQYNEPGKQQRTTEALPQGVFSRDEATKLWEARCRTGFIPVTGL